MPTVILGPNGQPYERPRSPSAPRPLARGIEGRYDSAQTTHDNRAHWSEADALSARAANLPGVRRTLRMRSRYERDNNSYYRGMVRTLADDTVGTGPRLQVRTGDATLNKTITEAFEEWSDAIKLGPKLHTFKESQVVDGECFLICITNPRLRTPVKLDLRLIEADQVADPYPWPISPYLDDGIVLDTNYLPIAYHVLRSHPGDLTQWGFPYDFDEIPYEYVIHWFRQERPNQYRGIPDTTPALPLFALLRRFTLATVSAAESAAMFAVLLKTMMTPAEADEQGDTIAPFQTEQIVRNMMTALPEGYDAFQLKPEHPATTYEMFRDAILNEIARCLNMPFNIAAGNSSRYNYASGRLDHQTYYKSVGVDQYLLETTVLDRCFAAWLTEAQLRGIFPDDIGVPKHQWFWDGREHVDPVKEANAEQIRLASNTDTLADIWARKGHDWRERIDQRAEEIAYQREKGVPIGDPSGTVLVPDPDEEPPPAPTKARIKWPA